MTSLAEHHAARLAHHRGDAAAAERACSRLGSARLALFAGGVVGAIAVIKTAPDWAPALLLPAAAFAALVVAHARARRRAALARAGVAFHERTLRRLEGRWHEDGPRGDDLRPDGHLYADDLDLFGPRSLFQLLAVTRTTLGARTLARWLAALPDAATSRLRQDAVAELAPDGELAERLAMLEPRAQGSDDPSALRPWAEGPPAPLAAWERPLAPVLAGLAVLATAGWSLDLTGLGPLGLVAVVAGLLNQFAGAPRRALAAGAREVAAGLPTLTGLLGELQDHPATSAGLAALQARVRGDRGHDGAREALAGLERLVSAVDDVARNPLWGPIAFLLQRHVLLGHRLERWRRTHGARVGDWIDAAGTFEALVALGTYAREHGGDAWPELVDDEVVLEGRDVGHPLLPVARCVRNDVALGPARALQLVSGSNMSGKSTWLRALGCNVVLARLGAPVRASSLRLAPLELGASIRVGDSLAEGVSRFYAEIRRLAALDALAREPRPCLLLLDEILAGTNSADRLRGASACVLRLVERGALVMVTTHDLALTTIVDQLGPRGENVHFADDVVDDQMRFDHRLRPGVVDRGNALRLMRSLGLDV